MMRAAYAALWWLATPLILARLAWRSRSQGGYLNRLGERFGSYAPGPEGPRIWVHAVSVGETRASAPLVEVLIRRYPGHRILLTHMTPTGRATGEELFGDRVERAWLPYDYGFATRRFFRHYRPAFGVVLETEIWPRLLEEGKRAGIPVFLANARLSERSARRYARLPGLTAWALGSLAGIAAQTDDDARRFAALGAPEPSVTGNIKFDLEIPEALLRRGEALRGAIGPGRTVIVAGSTRDGEEALLLDALSQAPPEVLLVIVPRHPQRFELVEDLARSRGLPTLRRPAGAGPAPGPDVRVLVGDSMGEMLAYYAAADVVILGGSLLAFGGQNLIEPCAVGKPVVIGPSTYNFEEAEREAWAAGATRRARDAAEAMREALSLLEDEPRRREMGERARAFAALNRGAVGRLADWIAARTVAAGLRTPV